MRSRALRIVAMLLTVMLVLVMVGCGNTGGKAVTEAGLYQAGTYVGVAQGKMGDIKVEVTFSENAIDKIEVVEFNETKGTADGAIDKIPARIIEGQTLVVDAVTGATATGDAIIQAVEDCVLQAGGDLTALKIGAEQKEKQVQTLEADIAVIGSGLSGLSTAISALENGASVIVVEKQAALGRSFATSFGNVMMAQVEENEAYHKAKSDDTLDQAIERWSKMTMQGGQEGIPYPDYERVKEIIVDSGATIAWLEQHGLEYQISFTKEQRGADIVKPVTDGNQVAGELVIERLTNSLKEQGATILTEATATELIEADGGVVGVKASSPDKNFVIHAKNVVLATGGFGGSEEYIEQLIPDILATGYQFSGTGVNTGDGMTMGAQVGAALYEDGWIIPSPGKLLPSKKLTDLNVNFNKLNSYSPLEGGVTDKLMLVNQAGQRMTNEAGPGVVIAADLIDAKEAPYYILFDSSSEEVVSLLETGLDSGDIYKANTMAELEKLSKMNHLVSTFNEYQSMAKKGVDTEFKKPAEMLQAYAAEGPYYLVKFVPDFVATMGGLKTTGDCQVVREDGTAIDGLYAVGELAHRFLYNRAHFGNASNSASLTMGRNVGKLLAEQVQQ
ncbi:FAD-dependent oxidoreductase [Paenibacillus lentus]|uniref:Urocanate reductase n=1 Tax=Paenibacillus lentus TaxID=1338368 RepID=A0A3S8RR55_9BACL|nr:FAD-dependent oxidoreductase [Paenibacillus lentus]AZK45329.1 FAD-dependent oxidoreductase [Paenibacillus lentus]